MTRILITLAGLASLVIMSVGAMASARMASAQLGTEGSATVGYPIKVDIQGELDASRVVKNGVYCAFMPRSQACPNSPWGRAR
jgi:hypothetical protein